MRFVKLRKGKNRHMKKLILLGTIATMALTGIGQAQSYEQRTGSNRVVTRHSTARTTAAVAPSTNRRVVTSYRTGGRYYSGGRYYTGYSPSYYGYGGPSVSVGFGGYYPSYGYGYPYNSYGYGYGYPSDYYVGYPSGYSTTYTTSRHGDLAYDDNVVAAVQERLRRAGYYLGPIDGVAGPATRSAVARWEGNHGMIADGRIDHRTLRSLGISA